MQRSRGLLALRDGCRVVGLTASNLSMALFHLEVRTANFSGTDAASNVGAVLTAADRLEMHDVTFTVGDAGQRGRGGRRRAEPDRARP